MKKEDVKNTNDIQIKNTDDVSLKNELSEFGSELEYILDRGLLDDALSRIQIKINKAVKKGKKFCILDALDFIPSISSLDSLDYIFAEGLLFGYSRLKKDIIKELNERGYNVKVKRKGLFKIYKFLVITFGDIDNKTMKREIRKYRTLNILNNLEFYTVLICAVILVILINIFTV